MDFYDSVDSISKIATYTKYNRIYQYVSNNITPNEKTIHNFIDKYDVFLEFIIELTLLTTFELDMTDFEHIAIDGTIKNANCNKYNLFSKKNLLLLIDHYSKKNLTEDEIEKLPKPCIK